MRRIPIFFLVGVGVLLWACLAYFLFRESLSLGILRSVFVAATIYLAACGVLIWYYRSESGFASSGDIDGCIKALAKGNVTEGVSCGEVNTELSNHLNQAVAKLRGALGLFSRGSVAAARSSAALEMSEKAMSEGIKSVVGQLNSAATASEELSKAAEEITRNCAFANDCSATANQVAQEGKVVVNTTVTAMSNIQGIVENVAATVKNLGSRSDEIGKIIDLIRGIASQTNLLALNAAIEAARAGEHGRGFAVVSDEVRKLAFETTEATEQIAETVESMQGDLGSAVRAMEDGVVVVREGGVEAGKSGEALQNILNEIEKLVPVIQQIAHASKEQTSTTGELSQNLQHVASVMDENAKSISSNLGVVERLAEIAGEMKRLIGGFKLVTPDDAKKMVERAVEYYHKYGREKAFAEFNDPLGQFVDGELYVGVQDYDGVMHAYGGDAPLVGRQLADLKDADGKYVAKTFMSISKNQGSGWHKYRFLNSHTDKVESKTSYVQALDNDYFISVGVYESDDE